MSCCFGNSQVEINADCCIEKSLRWSPAHGLRTESASEVLHTKRQYLILPNKISNNKPAYKSLILEKKVAQRFFGHAEEVVRTLYCSSVTGRSVSYEP